MIEKYLKLVFLGTLLSLTLFSCTKGDSSSDRPTSVPSITTLSINSITSTAALGGGYITSDGGETITARGICWSTSQNPLITGSHTVDGTGTGTFVSAIPGLNPNTTYYVRAYATNSVGTVYGNEISFITLNIAVTLPVLTTTMPSSVTTSTALSGGNIISDGGTAIMARGVCWSTLPNPIITGNHTTDGTGSGSFTSNIVGLTSSTVYHIRAYATNNIGTAYGNEISMLSSSTPVPSKSFVNLTFNQVNAYFSTDGTMTMPIDSVQAKVSSTTAKIDITFIYNYEYFKPGFFDPIARSQVWPWNEYYKPWLSSGVETSYFSTTLDKTNFDSAMADQSKIETFFSYPSTQIALHAIFPAGSCIGGRDLSPPQLTTLAQGKVYGFKNLTSGKRGLLYIRTDQASAWPIPVLDFNTKVDIIREN